MNDFDQDPETHPSSDLIAAYLDGGLSESEGLEVEHHLSDCAICRADMMSAARILQRLSRRRKWMYGAPLAAAAAAIAFLLTVPLPGTREGSTDGRQSTRTEASREATTTIESVGPTAGATVELGSLRLTWHDVGASTYSVTLTDELGESVWERNTTDTTVSVPDSIQLVRGAVYYWYVDALLPDASSATTGVLEFRITP